MKGILSKKGKLEEHEVVALTEECNAMIQNKLPAKFKDLGSFSIPFLMVNVCVDSIFCDLGSSVSLMPLSMCKNLDLGEMRPTTISLKLADRSLKCLVSVLEDVPIKIGDLYVLVDY